MKGKNEKRGFFALLGLALEILAGSLRLLRQYPVLVVPLIPVLLMVLGVEFGLLFVQAWYIALPLIFVVAYELMFSFVLSTNMLQQIHQGDKPSLVRAFNSSGTVRMIPKVFLLSIVWYGLVLILVAVEMAIKAVLGRSEEGGERAEGIVDSIFGTMADALRMMGFMMVAIMTFEGVGLGKGFKRLRSTLRESPISALSGLALTKVATTLIFLITWGVFQVIEWTGFWAWIVAVTVAGLGWMLAIYLEQLFATGLYLYVAFPESPIVGILLEKHIGRELPPLPVPGAAEQPSAS